MEFRLEEVKQGEMTIQVADYEKLKEAVVEALAKANEITEIKDDSDYGEIRARRATINKTIDFLKSRRFAVNEEALGLYNNQMKFLEKTLGEASKKYTEALDAFKSKEKEAEGTYQYIILASGEKAKLLDSWLERNKANACLVEKKQIEKKKQKGE